ncbi:cytochrome c peroxidase [Roseinatronobacter thiooxidans]|uniref:Cytochrome c peroxidase n=1 Tax=Roseinatronobacter thiooxidans TaxID=121821 RepID=A0A2W7Q931_9RHOB|nr:cytochrome c peroxidase [Roseinatronobacter thiooxidans]
MKKIWHRWQSPAFWVRAKGLGPAYVAGAVLLLSLGGAQAQTLNQGFAAMQQGDFFTAFTALRRLEQAGDPQASQMLQELFLTPPVQVRPPPPSPAPYARPPRQVAAAPPVAAPDLAPLRAPRPTARPIPHAPLDGSLPAPLSEDSFRAGDAALARIGHLLFFDPVLSGNMDVACATCHHPRHAAGDGVSLGLGTGAQGLGHDRRPDGMHAAHRRIPRNAPALWNLGARDIRVMFHDGRIEADPDTPGAVLTPQGPLDYMTLDSLLAVQALFPVLSAEEMAGQAGENPIADAIAAERIHGDDGAWALLAARVDALPDYRRAFATWRGADASVRMDEIANALAAFIEFEFRADQTPFDQYLRELAAMSPQAGEGMRLFFGRANCASCHSGPLLSDQKFHAMGQPPIGPGKEQDDDGYTRDIGRAAVTLDPADAYAFRTPMLRNVMQTGPWGHAGAFSDIRAFLRHHLDPVAGLAAYQPQAVLPELGRDAGDYMVTQDAHQRAAISAAAARAMTQRPLVILQDDEIDLLIAFLAALDDTGALQGRLGVPDAVPSGLEIQD